MTHANQNQPVSIPRRRGRGCLLWLGGGMAVLFVLFAAGAIYEPVAVAADAQAYPPPGQLVDVGGYRMHIRCTGAGSPTVVIDAGMGAWSSGWEFMHPAVAPMTRVCTYDRAGTGWSEPGPLPRDARQFTKELHTLLQNAGIPGPYVLAGHSLGGLPVRVFANEYPAEVVGVVLIDSMSPKPGAPAPTSINSSPGTPTHVSSPITSLARFGILRWGIRLAGLFTTLSPAEKADYAVSMRPHYLQAVADEAQGIPDSLVQAGAVKTLGDLPLIVLSRGLDQDPIWQAQQAALARLSSNSQHLVAEKSGHNIDIDQPEVAVAAIVQMVKQVR